ncbi:transcriptional regulator, MarR family [Mizugakiibacter sediminis]|uniref:Transcriptional regulator, MarR family n=1 Tax=Mizugakiibacter sediminis TaxID=1475481 RepID=A0A0K8QL16_9GAMM|nr:MarR family transcriptional regulator [Mizugakiibacter sediminis]GAP65544.1 transcriptional regulator, MarR family [Mizugakiibacter sediminis]
MTMRRAIPRSHEHDLLVLVSQVRSEMLGRVEHELAEVGVENYIVYVGLKRLGMQGPMTVAELAAALRQDRATMRRTCAQLERQGHIRRLAGTRTARYGLTDGGRALLAQAQARGDQALKRCVAGASPDEVVQLSGALGRFLGHLRSAA